MPPADPIRTSPLSRDLIVGALKTCEPLLKCVREHGHPPVVAGTAAMLLNVVEDHDARRIIRPNDLDILSTAGLTDTFVNPIVQTLVAAGKITQPLQRAGIEYNGESYRFDVLVDGVAIPVDWIDPHSLRGSAYANLVMAREHYTLAGTSCPPLSTGAVLGLKFLAARPRDLQELPRLLGSEGGQRWPYAHYDSTFQCLATYAGVDTALNFYDEIKKSIPHIHRPDPVVLRDALKDLAGTYYDEVSAKPAAYPDGAKLATSVRLFEQRDNFIRCLRHDILGFPTAARMTTLHRLARTHLDAQETLVTEHREGRGLMPLSNVDIVAASSPIRRVLALTRAYAPKEQSPPTTPTPPVVEITLSDPLVLPVAAPSHAIPAETTAVLRVRKKPVEVHALRWTGENTSQMLAFLGRMTTEKDTNAIVIRTLEGEVTCRPGAWVVRGLRGEFYPVQDDIFRATYDFVQALALTE